MALKAQSSWASFGGVLGVYDHESSVCGCSMRFGVFTPPQAATGRVPVVWYLSGLTCSWANVMELSALIAQHFPANMSAQGIMGHSMGGHGALTLHLKAPNVYRSVSAFSPIVAPSQVPWGKKAFTNYLGSNRDAWMAYDATALVAENPSRAEILIDQGDGDDFLAEQLRPDLFEKACAKAGQKLTLRMQKGYDHSYYFIASFMEDHLRHHHKALSS